MGWLVDWHSFQFEMSRYRKIYTANLSVYEISIYGTKVNISIFSESGPQWRSQEFLSHRPFPS
jgi:hypothetical protein